MAINYLKNCFISELVKLKRSFAFWLATISALFMPVMMFFYYNISKEKLLLNEKARVWEIFMYKTNTSIAGLLIPLFVVLLVAMVLQVEHKSHGFKFVFSSPVPKWSLYFGKLGAILFLLLYTYLLYFVSLLGIGMLIGLIHPEFGFFESSPDITRFLNFIGRHSISILGILGIQYWLSFRFNNVIIPVSIGMILVIGGALISQNENAFYYPYVYGMLITFAQDTAIQWQIMLSSLGTMTVAILLGYLDVSRMNIKS